MGTVPGAAATAGMDAFFAAAADARLACCMLCKRAFALKVVGFASAEAGSENAAMVALRWLVMARMGLLWNRG